jgi:hypothetical protein
LKTAIDFLQSALRDGPQRIKQIIANGEKRAHSARTIRRAAKSLGIIKDGQKWKLANNTL